MTDTYNACPNCGGPVWDNRAKKASGQFTPKSPDFTCRDKECAWAMWPTENPVRANTYTKRPQAAPTAAPTQPTAASAPTRQQVAQRREQVRAAYGDCVDWVLANAVPSAAAAGATVDVQAMAFSVFKATYGVAREFAFPAPRQQQPAVIPPPPPRRPEPPPPTEADYPEALQDEDDDLPFN